MPITMTLTEGGRIWHIIFTDPWQPQDMDPLFAQDGAYRNSTPYKVHALIDMSASKQVPPGALKARHSPSVTHPNRGHVAIIVRTPVLKTLAETVFRLAHFQQVRFFDTADQGWAYLRSVIAQEKQAPPEPPKSTSETSKPSAGSQL